MLRELKQQNRYDDSDSSHGDKGDPETLNQGIWLEEQVLKFMTFSNFNVNILASKLQRRTTKVFKEMAKFIGTRTSTQCRSQNQKLIKKHKNIKRILKAYEIQIGKKEFENACNQHYNALKAMSLGKRKNLTDSTHTFVSVHIQTEFSSDSEDSPKELVKAEEQLIPQHYLAMPYLSYPDFTVFAHQLEKASIE